MGVWLSVGGEGTFESAYGIGFDKVPPDFHDRNIAARLKNVMAAYMARASLDVSARFTLTSGEMRLSSHSGRRGYELIEYKRSRKWDGQRAGRVAFA